MMNIDITIQRGVRQEMIEQTYWKLKIKCICYTGGIDWIMTVVFSMSSGKIPARKRI